MLSSTGHAVVVVVPAAGAAGAPEAAPDRTQGNSSSSLII